MENQTFFKKQREAILNDEHRQELFKMLLELYSKSMPIVLKEKNGDIKCMYADSVEESAQKIKDQIALRDNQIFHSIKQ